MPETSPALLNEYRQMHPADLADALQRLPLEEAAEVMQQLSRPLAARTLDELEKEKAADLLEVFPPDALVDLLTELPPDAIADLAAAMSPAKRRLVFASLPEEKARDANALLRYPPDTAGGIMSNRFLSVGPDLTVQQCIERLRSRPEPRSDEVSYLYVTADQRLLGVVPMRDLVFRQPDRRLGDIMHREVQYLRADADQEEIARQFAHYHFLALPVLDPEGRLVGIVRASDALEIARAEATEDMQLMVGLSGEERALTPWTKAVRKRLPWLLVNLGTAFLAAGVVNFFESTIAQWTALAVFLPIIAGQGGNAGAQTLTVIIRDLALGELSPGDGRRALTKELILAAINGLAVGLVVGVLGYLWKDSIALGLVAGTAMLLNALAAAIAGVAIPFGLRAVRVDPALASSIFVTTVTDVAGFAFFLGLGLLAMRLIGIN